MDEQTGYEFLIKPEPPDREITPREALVMTLDFLKSDFYRFVWYPRYQAEMELTDINAMLQNETNVICKWLGRRAALRAIQEAWISEWLNPPESQRKEDYQALIDIEPEMLMSSILNE